MPKTITSVANPTVKALLSLRRHRERVRENVTLIEGFVELSLALDSNVVPRALYFCSALVREQSQFAALNRIDHTQTEIVELSKQAFEKVTYRENPDGWLAVAPAFSTALAELCLGPRPLVVVCESVEKPGNLGAILRTAEAAGVDAVISACAVTDWGNPNVIRASKGAVFAVPVAQVETGELVEWLNDKAIPIVVATPAATVSYADINYVQGAAIVVGAEKHGVSKLWLDRAAQTIRIPMFGQVNSLNVATSAAITIYEAVRQRLSHDAKC